MPGVSLFVLVLLAYTMFRFRRGANPEPSRTSHHTMLEVVWTLVPVLILVAIAVPSIRLLAAQYSPPPADLTIKVVGHQWYWSYQYPDNGGFEIVSNMLKEKGDPTLKPGERFRTDADGPIMLATDERLVIPAGKVVKFLITSEDVINSLAVPTSGPVDTTRAESTGWGQVTARRLLRHAASFASASLLSDRVEVLPKRSSIWIAPGRNAQGASPRAASKQRDIAPTDARASSVAPGRIEQPVAISLKGRELAEKTDIIAQSPPTSPLRPTIRPCAQSDVTSRPFRALVHVDNHKASAPCTYLAIIAGSAAGAFRAYATRTGRPAPGLTRVAIGAGPAISMRAPSLELLITATAIMVFFRHPRR